MSIPTFSAFDLIQRSEDNLSLLHGDGKVRISSVSPVERPLKESLVFASSDDQVERAINAGASIVVVTSSVGSTSYAAKNATVLVARQLNLAMAEVLGLFDLSRRQGNGRIHPTAQIAKSAQVPDSCSVGAFVVIGENTRVGENTRLDAHVVLGREVLIGSNCWLHPHVVVEDDSQIGHRCEIHANTTIGSDGFGYAQKKDKSSVKIPQIGRVVIEDDVEIGANCAIDRATLLETKICMGAKLDNHVHIAHNCSVGPHSLITAGFLMAGSSHLGAHFMSGGGAAVTDHVKICDNVSIGGFSAVTKDILEPGAYTGYPLEKWKDGLRTLSNLTSLTEMRRQLSEIRKHLGLNREEK